ncbi:Protein EMBRYO DEFECTIVE 514 [Mucuna pruriens]|uniref:Protein EMBRYO DEFECTIVE 514 n=1 Tax=Mucuna pruriens TaxID=157652 RepID=A0A371F130_MUCPR|nr:Protein EMBRYO DEFECTIVE 514 [Mucuna pruriens]
MAEGTASEPEIVEPTSADAVADMAVGSSEPNKKRTREDNNDEGVLKKLKVELEEDEEEMKPVKLGFKSFATSVEMFDYFYNLLHTWPPYVNLNEYEHRMLLELLKKGHAEADEKIGGGIRVFQVRKHAMWKSRCFFLIREEDESVDDFSFRKCVNHILPLPEEMQVKPDANKALGGGKGKHHHRGKSGAAHGKKGQ